MQNNGVLYRCPAFLFILLYLFYFILFFSFEQENKPYRSIYHAEFSKYVKFH